MKKYIGIIFCMCLVFVIFAGCKNNLDRGSINDDDLNSWIGKYEFGEVSDIHSDIRPNPSWVYTISIYKEKSDYYANIDVDGFQTIVRLKSRVKGAKDLISLVFETYLPDNISESYKINDVLLRLEKVDSEIITYWSKLKPNLSEDEEAGKVYFKKCNS
jgi:hypothetical protein